jgi:hypothetical protein
VSVGELKVYISITIDEKSVILSGLIACALFGFRVASIIKSWKRFVFSASQSPTNTALKPSLVSPFMIDFILLGEICFCCLHALAPVGYRVSKFWFAKFLYHLRVEKNWYLVVSN